MRWPFLRRLSLRIKLIIPTQQKLLLHLRGAASGVFWDKTLLHYDSGRRATRIAWPVSHAASVIQYFLGVRIWVSLVQWHISA